MGAQPQMAHISDTARWVAYYRALETERADALFRDPLARVLAGAQGEQIALQIPGGAGNAWTMIVRTHVLDEMIMRLVREGKIDAVINLAAGLDSRPYRLDLPKNFRWFEVDLPGILAYKEPLLAKSQPNCTVERFAQDLAAPAERRALFAKLGGLCQKALVLTEGLLIYLPEPLVAELARDLRAVSSVHYWLQDVATPDLLALLNRRWSKALQAANAPFVFAPADGPQYYGPFGWRPVEIRYAIPEALRLGRLPLLLRALTRLWRVLLSQKARLAHERNSIYLLLERS